MSRVRHGNPASRPTAMNEAFVHDRVANPIAETQKSMCIIPPHPLVLPEDARRALRALSLAATPPPGVSDGPPAPIFDGRSPHASPIHQLPNYHLPPSPRVIRVHPVHPWLFLPPPAARGVRGKGLGVSWRKKPEVRSKKQSMFILSIHVHSPSAPPHKSAQEEGGGGGRGESVGVEPYQIGLRASPGVGNARRSRSQRKDI
jgi:hypothetical protein